MFAYSNQTYFVKDTNLNLFISEINLCLAHCPLAQSTAGLPNTNNYIFYLDGKKLPPCLKQFAENVLEKMFTTKYLIQICNVFQLNKYELTIY